MTLGSSLVLYLMFGGGVAAALGLRGEERGTIGTLRLATACLFWPLFVPVVLSALANDRTAGTADSFGRSEAVADPLQREIAKVESELDRALQTLDGWAEAALPWEGARFDELKQAWRVQAERIRDLSELLTMTGDESPARADEPLSESSPCAESRKRQSESARRENIDRLHELHQRMQDDLLGNLAWVRELVTLIHLAKYTGAPASRAEDLVAQIAAAVEGLSRVSDWQSGAATVVTTAAD